MLQQVLQAVNITSKGVYVFFSFRWIFFQHQKTTEVVNEKISDFPFSNSNYVSRGILILEVSFLRL